MVIETIRKKIIQFIARLIGNSDGLNILNERTRSLVLLFGFSVGVVIARMVYIFLYALWGFPGQSLIHALFVVAIVLNLVRLRRHRANIASVTSTFIAIMMVLSLFLLMSGGLPGTRSLWTILVPLVAFFLEGRRRGMRWTGSLLLFIIILQIARAAGLIALPYTVLEINQLIGIIIFIGFMLMVVEIGTEKYEHELESQKNELSKFKQATDSATDGILMTDPEGRIVYVNRAWEKLTGYPSAEVLGKNPSILNSGKTPPAVFQKMWQTLEAGQPFVTEEVINRRKDGREYASQMHIFPIRFHDKNFFFVEIQQDITERKAVDRAKTEFVSLASHQLQTPLSAISWFTELLEGGQIGPLNAQQRHFIRRITESNRNMIALVSALLNTSRIDLGTFSIISVPTDLEQLVREEVSECQVGHPAIPAITLAIQPDIPKVDVDQNLYRIIVQNLVTNAIRYTPIEGQVSIKLGIDGRDVMLTVADTGIGIPSADQSKLYSKLYRGAEAKKREPGGTGLGLYIVKAIIDQGGGSISVDSAPGRGTTFTVRTPLTGMKSSQGTRQLSREL